MSCRTRLTLRLRDCSSGQSRHFSCHVPLRRVFRAPRLRAAGNATPASPPVMSSASSRGRYGKWPAMRMSRDSIAQPIAHPLRRIVGLQIAWWPKTLRARCTRARTPQRSASRAACRCARRPPASRRARRPEPPGARPRPALRRKRAARDRRRGLPRRRDGPNKRHRSLLRTRQRSWAPGRQRVPLGWRTVRSGGRPKACATSD